MKVMIWAPRGNESIDGVDWVDLRRWANYAAELGGHAQVFGEAGSEWVSTDWGDYERVYREPCGRQRGALCGRAGPCPCRGESPAGAEVREHRLARMREACQ